MGNVHPSPSGKSSRHVKLSDNRDLTYSSRTPFDIAIAGGGVDPYVTFTLNAKVARYKTSTHLWSTPDDWNPECSGCVGFGIDAIMSTNTYYAAERGDPTSKLVVGSIAG